MEPHKNPDPLLTTARAVLGLFMGLLIFAMVLVSIGVGAVLTVQREELAARIAAEGLAPWTFWAIVACLLGVVAVLFLGLRFVIELREIVASVDEGDPFVPENAGHLARMGWLVLAIQLLAIVLGIAAARIVELTGEPTEVGSVLLLSGERAEVGVSGGGFVLALTLFVLARVFRKGTEMREELEGTV